MYGQCAGDSDKHPLCLESSSNPIGMSMSIQLRAIACVQLYR